MTATLNAILKEPDPLRAFLRLDELYRLSDAPERAELRAGWDFGRVWHIPGPDYSDMDRIVFKPLFGEDACGLDAEAKIEARLTYHAIQNAQDDFRDNTMDVCLCYHAALSAGLDVTQIFEEAAMISEKWMAGLFRGYIQWKPEQRSLWVMGFRETIAENAIIFEWIGCDNNYEDLKPKHLDSWGRELEG